jgi:hypothetical protein
MTIAAMAGMLTNIPEVMEAVTMCTPAQSTVSPPNSRSTAGRAATAGASGQKSWARRAMTGRPITTEPRNTTANATVVAIGWMKYANVLPLTRPTSVRTVRPSVASTRIAGIGMARMTRRKIATYAHASAAAIATGALILFTTTKNMIAGMTVASIRFGSPRRATALSNGSISRVGYTRGSSAPPPSMSIHGAGSTAMASPMMDNRSALPAGEPSVRRASTCLESRPWINQRKTVLEIECYRRVMTPRDTSLEPVRNSDTGRQERYRLDAALRAAAVNADDLEATTRRLLLARLSHRSDDFAATKALQALNVCSAGQLRDAPSNAKARLRDAGLGPGTHATPAYGQSGMSVHRDAADKSLVDAQHNPVLSAEQSFMAAQVHALLAIEQRLGELLTLLRSDARVGQMS